MSKNKVAVIFVLIILVIFGSVGYGIYLCRVQFIGEKSVGDISKDENENVWAYGYVTLYNGGKKDKKIIFNVDNDGCFPHLDEQMKEEKYDVIKIEVLSGNGQVDENNMVLTIPGNEQVRVKIEAHNIYIGEEYRGKIMGLQREAPHISFHVIK